ncbi:MAG: T9SS type A sorting domain-containing protein [Saprospiraceae bacterium]|nr:T9SS type A sorting domain-containing protein [Saprospiraceae bacterium]
MKHRTDLELEWVGTFQDVPGSLSNTFTISPKDLLFSQGDEILYLSHTTDQNTQVVSPLINWFSDSTGDVIQVKKVTLPGMENWTGHGSIMRPDSVSFILPCRVEADNILVLACLDTSGQILWRQEYLLNIAGTLQGSFKQVILPDQSIIISLTANALDKAAYFLHVDSAGIFLSLSDAPYQGYNDALQLHPSGNLIYVSRPDILDSDLPCSRIYMLDPVAFDTLWSREFWHWEPPYDCTGPSSISEHSLVISQDGDILVGIEFGRNYLLVEYSSTGTEKWRRIIDMQPYSDSLNYSLPYFRDCIRTSDDGILISGHFTVPPENPVDYASRVFLLKLDSVGCLVPGCDKTIITSTEAEEVRLENECWHLMPNPAGSWAQVKIDQACPRAHLIDRVVLYNTQGQKIRTHFGQPGQDHFILDTGLLPSGTYVVQLLAGPVILGSKTMVVSH